MTRRIRLRSEVADILLRVGGDINQGDLAMVLADFVPNLNLVQRNGEFDVEQNHVGQGLFDV